MAVTIHGAASAHRWHLEINFTADGSADFVLPGVCMKGMAWTSDGNDGAGTLTWFVSEDGSNYAALGVNTATDPANPTTIVSATTAGTWVVHEHDLVHAHWRFPLSGSTGPNLNVHIHGIF